MDKPHIKSPLAVGNLSDAEIAEQISALMDDALPTAQAQTLLEQLLSEPRYQQIWADYHLIGDQLQHGVAEQAIETNFLTQVQQRLADEPYPLPIKPQQRLGASRRWWGAAAMAAGVVFVMWAGLPLLRAPVGSGAPALGLASLSNPSVNANSSQVRQQERNLDPYLRVHQQSAGWSRVHAAPTYIRYVDDPNSPRAVH
jgi:negative regulator of sigma E activity